MQGYLEKKNITASFSILCENVQSRLADKGKADQMKYLVFRFSLPVEPKKPCPPYHATLSTFLWLVESRHVSSCRSVHVSILKSDSIFVHLPSCSFLILRLLPLLPPLFIGEASIAPFLLPGLRWRCRLEFVAPTGSFLFLSSCRRLRLCGIRGCGCFYGFGICG